MTADGNSKWVWSQADGGIKLNNVWVELPRLIDFVKLEVDTLPEPTIYLAGDAQISYQRVAEVASTLHGTARNLVIFLVTGSQVQPNSFACLRFYSNQIPADAEEAVGSMR